MSFHYSGQIFLPKTFKEMIEVEARWSEDDLGRRKLRACSKANMLICMSF